MLSGQEWGDKINVGLLGIVLAHALLGLPSVPLSSGLEAGEHAWLLSGVVTVGGLLEESVDLRLLLVGELWLLISDLLSDFVKVRHFFL